jgi:hypothetical protein
MKLDLLPPLRQASLRQIIERFFIGRICRWMYTFIIGGWFCCVLWSSGGVGALPSI